MTASALPGSTPTGSNLPDTRPARAAILKALRSGTPTAPLPLPDLAAYRTGPFAGVRDPADDRAALIARFEAAARGWRSEVVHATPAEAPQVVRAALDRHGCTRIAIGTGGPLQPLFDVALRGLAVQRFDRPIEDWKATLFDAVDAGITHVEAGLADTGTLLLLPGPGEPRTLSLVPSVHVAVLAVSRLHEGLPAALAALGVPARLPTNLVLVTGPSRTADIQLTTAYGAHGPKALVIVLVDDSVAAAPHTAPATDGAAR
jgi:L-lactate dehydrogenase complex protein LldG